MKKKLNVEGFDKEIKQHIEPEAGRLLISEPLMHDEYFGRSVIMLCEHNEEGSVGFIINKPTTLTINEAIEDFPPFDAKLYFGGPVQTTSVHFIHTLGEKLPGSIEIFNGIYWGGDFEVLKFLADTKQISSNDIRFFMGYSGWEPKQLKKELRKHTWFIGERNKRFPFTKDPGHLWREVLKSMGKQFSVIANFPEDPSLN